MASSRYDKCLSEMYAMRRFGIKLGLETITSILRHLDAPQNNYRIIHIAGTNGKGSVAAMLSTILHKAGYCVGRYTSPHLERFNERICIDNDPIGDDDVLSAYEKVKSAPGLDRELTFFEFTTAMALYFFSRRQVDWAVVETGMGGRLDATNVVIPDLSIITNISLEHKAYLGNTLADIAREKAGTIKNGVPLITGVTQRSCRKAILDQAAKLEAPVLLKARDFRYRRNGKNRLSYFGLNTIWRDIDLTLNGDHQVDNAALVLAACEALISSGQADLAESIIRQGLMETRWPGRLELVSTNPDLVLDGAHNLMAARKLAGYLKDRYRHQRITLVIGVLDDKPCESILKDLMEPCRYVVVTQPAINRAVPADVLAKTALKYSSDVKIIPNVKMAIEHALARCNAEDVICIAGSLYVVGEAKSALRQMGIG